MPKFIEIIFLLWLLLLLCFSHCVYGILFVCLPIARNNYMLSLSTCIWCTFWGHSKCCWLCYYFAYILNSKLSIKCSKCFLSLSSRTTRFHLVFEWTENRQRRWIVRIGFQYWFGPCIRHIRTAISKWIRCYCDWQLNFDLLFHRLWLNYELRKWKEENGTITNQKSITQAPACIMGWTLTNTSYRMSIKWHPSRFVGGNGGT